MQILKDGDDIYYVFFNIDYESADEHGLLESWEEDMGFRR